MSHAVIVGQSLSGKTVLSRWLASQSVCSGIPVVAFDPVNPPGIWGRRVHVLREPAEVLECFWRSSRCLFILDEFRILCDHDPGAVRRMLTIGRHVNPETGGGGHACILIGQRWTMLDKTCREQATKLYAFKQGVDDARELARHWACPELSDAASLGRLEYMAATTMEYLGRKKVRVPG